MRQVIMELPAMYADHHVTRVRQTLLALEGVQEVQASAAARAVRISYDEGLLSEGRLLEALSEAGYAPGSGGEIGEFVPRHQDGSYWYTVAGRITSTEMKDREMAGDFRRY